ncbi:MAG: DsrE family protein [Acidiphilium sp.]
MKPTRRALFATAAAALAWPVAARANPSMLKTFDYAHPIFAHPHPFAAARVVIQVREDDPVRWSMALSNAQNMLKLMGQDRTQIVIVAYGPGLKMLLAASPPSMPRGWSSTPATTR